MKMEVSIMEFVLLAVIVAAILFVPKVTQASPYIEGKITNMRFNREDRTFRLYTTLTNVGDQDANVYQLNVNEFVMVDANGNPLMWFKNAKLVREACYVKAGYHVDNVEWVISVDMVNFSNNFSPDYRGKTQIRWDADVKYDPVR